MLFKSKQKGGEYCAERQAEEVATSPQGQGATQAKSAYDMQAP